MKYINFLSCLLFVISMVSACDESELILSQQQGVVAGNVKVSSELSEAGKQRLEESLGYHSVEIVGSITNPDEIEIESYGVLLSELPEFSLSQAVEYTGDSWGKLENFPKDCYSVKIDGLKDDVTYYFRYFVKHIKGISYSECVDVNYFTTIKHPRAPETRILTENYIDVLEVKSQIVHDGHFAITECGVYMGLSEKVLDVKLKAAKVPDIVNHQGEYTVDVSGQGLKIGDFFYCQPYAVNEKGEAKGEIVKLEVKKAKAYAKLMITERKVFKNKVILSVLVESVGDQYIKEYGYYDIDAGSRHILKENLTAETSPKKGEIIEVSFNDLKMGEKHTIYMYAVNAEGEESLEPVEYYEFMAGIQGKNKDDKDLIYLELGPIDSNGKKYYFLDRNLGATMAFDTGVGAESYEDMGWLFQHGRSADGHQLYDSPFVQKVSLNGSFQTMAEFDKAMAASIRFVANSKSWAWLNPEVHNSSNLWTASGGKNNPCPDGYRVPTKAELSIMNENRPILKLGATYRWRTAGGGAYKDDQWGYIWGIDMEIMNSNGGAKYVALQLNATPGTLIGINSVEMGQGCYVRCIRVE